MVETLLKGGAVPDATDREGYTSLIRAAERGDVDIVEILLPSATPSPTRRPVRARPRSWWRRGAAMPRSCALLLAKKADPNMPDFTGRTALTYARQTGTATHRGHAAQGRRTRMMSGAGRVSAARPRRSGSPGALALDPAEIQESFVRAAGPGGQHVNTTSTAVQLRFDVRHSPSLPDDVRQRLERLAGRRLTRDGVLVLVAQGERSQKRNREEALARLVALIRAAARPPTPRKKTRPPKASKRRRLDDKKHHGAVKSLRARPSHD